MIGIHTQWVIAMVAHEHPFRWFYPCSEKIGVMACRIGAASGATKLGIAAMQRTGRPQPARRPKYGVNRSVFVDLSPVPLRARFAVFHADKIPLSHRGNNTFRWTP
jgi:hypothetical protein